MFVRRIKGCLVLFVFWNFDADFKAIDNNYTTVVLISKTIGHGFLNNRTARPSQEHCRQLVMHTINPLVENAARSSSTDIKSVMYT